MSGQFSIGSGVMLTRVFLIMRRRSPMAGKELTSGTEAGKVRGAIGSL